MNQPQTRRDAHLEDRLAGAVWGLFAGDAYWLGSHGPGAAAHGHGPNAKLPGDLTHDGDGALVLLEALAGHGVDPAAYGRALVARYREPNPKRYLDGPTRHLVAARARLSERTPFDQGADDDGTASTSRLAPLVVLRLGHPALMLDVDAVTRVLQDNDRAVAYACTHARLLEHLLVGCTLDDALGRVDAVLDRRTPIGAELGEHVDTARREREREVAAFTAACGRGGRLVEAFPAALQAALAHADDPVGAIHATCRAGGDSAGRAMLVGSWLGARHGVAAIPAEWRGCLRDRAAIARALERLLARRRPPAAPTRH
jgi:ADP-ribosylglycohydrolase